MKKVMELIRAASRLMTECNRAAITAKGRSNFVTDVDVAVQEYIRKGLMNLYPDYGFMSEEQENAPDFKKPLWILDPIDGTANFITHYHQSAISLALYQEGEVVFGAVYNPFTDELFSAEKGKGAFCNGERIFADHEVEFQSAIIDLGTMPYYKNRAKEVGRMTEELILRAGDMRRIGSAALAMAYTAAGRTGAMLEGVLQPWDFAAGKLIALEAGAIVSDWEGAPLDVKNPSSVLVSGRKVYDELMRLIKDVRNEMDQSE